MHFHLFVKPTTSTKTWAILPLMLNKTSESLLKGQTLWRSLISITKWLIQAVATKDAIQTPLMKEWARSTTDMVGEVTTGKGQSSQCTTESPMRMSRKETTLHTSLWTVEGTMTSCSRPIEGRDKTTRTCRSKEETMPTSVSTTTPLSMTSQLTSNLEMPDMGFPTNVLVLSRKETC